MIELTQPRKLLSEALEPRLLSRGFDRVSETKWVRSHLSPIRWVIALTALKGASWNPCWGVSLDFVPRVTLEGRITWHRTPKSSVIDLGFDPLDFYDRRDRTAFDWTIHPFQDMASAGRHAVEVAARVEAEALPWLDAVTDVRSLLAAFEREERRPALRFAFDNHVQYRLAFAFTLERAGESDRARVELDRWFQSMGIQDDVRDAVRTLLPTAIK